MDTQENIKSPLVSICIPIYNSENTIKKTIESLLSQIYPNIEIIIVDNKSSDRSLQIVKNFLDPRIKIFPHENHLPCAEYNWNRCFQYANGKYLTIFHADDVYSPDIIACQVDFFEKEPNIGVIFTLGNIINEFDEVIGTFSLPSHINNSTPYGYKEIFSAILEYGDFLITPSAMLKKDLYTKLSPFRYDQFYSASDLDMWLRAAKNNPIVILGRKLINYRVSTNSGSYKIHYLRVEEADFFKVMDFHLAKANENGLNIAPISIYIYEVHRLDDILMNAKNFLEKRDVHGFFSHINKIYWITYVHYAITHPHLFKWILSEYLNFIRLYITALIEVIFPKK